MRLTLLIFFVSALFAVQASAQKTALTTAILARDADDYVKAKESIDQVVLNEKTMIDPKAWFYRGFIYQNLAQIMVNPDGYYFNPVNGITEGDVETFLTLTDDPVGVAFDSYKKCLELDAKQKWTRKVDDNLRDVLGYMAFNMGGINFQKGLETDNMDKEYLMKAYDQYSNLYKIMDLMTEPSRIVFKQNLAKDAALDTDLHLVRFNMANAAFNAENWEVAEKEYKELVRVKLPEFMVYRNLSYIYKERKDVDALRDLWNHATDNFDGSTELGKSLALEEAVFYQEIGELEVLIEKLRAAIGLDPTNASLYNVLGGIYTQKVVDHNNALSDEKADQTKKLQEDVYTTLFSDAEKLLLKAQELDAKEPTNFTQLGSLYLSEGLVAYNQNQRLSSSKSDLAKGKILTDKFRAAFAKAQVQFEKGLEVDDKNKAALEYLSKIHIWNGDLAKSMEYKNRLKEIEG